ncbi:TenA family protein [Oceaniglobus indicus]|uniref:TenA family protein n=1 Tax=Oceaniglobus indicus TaxID=2047749 RepID=UPI00130476DC|nr:TenA family protein [Oceaniglobus indicus]
MSRAAEGLRQRHAEALRGFIEHPFFVAAADGSLSPAARDRYFLNERHFVGAARGIFAHLLIKAPDLPSARHLIGILEALVNEQEPLFDRIFASLSLSTASAPRPAAVALSRGMTQVAQERSYAEGIAAMLAAEWTYGTVATTHDWNAATDQTMRDWFQLHAESRYLNGVSWLENELERVISTENAALVDQAFLDAITLEIAFHDDPIKA